MRVRSFFASLSRDPVGLQGRYIGAVAGTATGAVIASQGTEHLSLPAETRLQFTLNAAVTVRP